MSDEFVDLRNQFWRGRLDGHVALDVAAAIAYQAVQGSTKALTNRKDYSEALDIVASALAQLIPVYTRESPREEHKEVTIDLVRQSFARGATRLLANDGTALLHLTVMKSDLWDAVSRFRSRGLPLFVLPDTANSAGRNAILAALPVADYARIERQLERVTLRAHQVLYAEGERPRYVYFPLSAVAALLYSVRDGTAAAIAIVGNDGMTGLRLLSEATSSRLRSVVEIGGEAYRMPGEALLEEFRRGEALHELLLRYLQALFIQTSQTAVCNRRHSVEQQLCRWLLLYLDRLPSNEVRLTHEMISDTLGVRRAGITKAATALQRAGLIRYKRGRIVVPDRKGLLARGCECCAVGTIRMVRLRTDAAHAV